LALQKSKTPAAPAPAAGNGGTPPSKGQKAKIAEDQDEDVDEEDRMDVQSDDADPSTKTKRLIANDTNGHKSGLVSGGQHDTSKSPQKRRNQETKEEEDERDEDDDDDEPVKKRTRRGAPSGKQHSLKEESSSKPREEPPKTKAASSKVAKKVEPKESPSKVKTTKDSKAAVSKGKKPIPVEDGPENEDESLDDENSKSEGEQDDLEEDDQNEDAAPEKVQSALKASGKDPYPDWKHEEPVPYAALCKTFSLIEMTSKRLIITAHCSLFLRQVLRLTPQDLLPTIQLMINKLAADYAGIELGIGESLIMKAIGESTGRSLQVIKADQAEIGDLGLVAAKSRSNQPTMFKPKPLTVKGVLDGLMAIAITSGDGSQGRKIAGIKKLLSAADAAHAGKGSKGIDITTNKGGASESKFIIRFLEGKLRLGLAERTVLVSLAHAMVSHEVQEKSNKVPSSEKLAEGEAILKTVYRYAITVPRVFPC